MKQFPLKHIASYKIKAPNPMNRKRWMILNIHSLRSFSSDLFSENDRVLPNYSEYMDAERLPIGFYSLPKARASMRTCFAVRFYYQIHSGDKSWPFNGPINRARCPITVLLITRPPIKMEKMKAKKKKGSIILLDLTPVGKSSWPYRHLWLIEEDGEN